MTCPCKKRNPSYATHPIVRQIVGRLHVSESDAAVEKLILSKLSGKATPAQKRAIVKGAIAAHHANQREYGWVMGGGHGYTRKNPYKTKRFRVRELKGRRGVDKRSIRTKRVGRHGKMIRVGCPKPYWMPRKKRCRVGMRALSMLIPRKKRHKSRGRGRR